MIGSTWAGKRMNGYRGQPQADIEAVIETLLRLSQLAQDFPSLLELEINPLRVFELGQGALALDLRARDESMPNTGAEL